jgi:hypothetical protein
VAAAIGGPSSSHRGACPDGRPGGGGVRSGDAQDDQETFDRGRRFALAFARLRSSRRARTARSRVVPSSVRQLNSWTSAWMGESRSALLVRGMTAAVTGCVERDVRRRASGCCWRAKAGARGIAAFWPGVNSSRRAERTSSRRSIDDQAATGPERVGPDIFQSGPIIRCGAHAPLFVLPDTGNDGMFVGLSGGPASRRSWEREGSTPLSPVRAWSPRTATTRQQRLELPTILWSVVPSGLDSPRHGSTSRSGARAPLRRLLLGRLPAGRQRRGGREVLARATARARIAPVSAPVLPSERHVAVA